MDPVCAQTHQVLLTTPDRCTCLLGLLLADATLSRQETPGLSESAPLDIHNQRWVVELDEKTYVSASLVG